VDQFNTSARANRSDSHMVTVESPVALLTESIISVPQAAHDEVKQTIQTEVARFKQQCMRKCKEIWPYEIRIFKQGKSQAKSLNICLTIILCRVGSLLV